jgi:hypothetical protein
MPRFRQFFTSGENGMPFAIAARCSIDRSASAAGIKTWVASGLRHQPGPLYSHALVAASTCRIVSRENIEVDLRLKMPRDATVFRKRIEQKEPSRALPRRKDLSPVQESLLNRN